MTILQRFLIRRQMPEVVVIVDVITMNMCVPPCIVRIQAARPAEVPCVDMGKFEDFVGVVSKTGAFLKPTLQ